MPFRRGGAELADASLKLDYQFKADENLYASYIKGPWLKVGEGSFGVDKHDASSPVLNGMWAGSGPAARIGLRTLGLQVHSLPQQGGNPSDDG